MQRKIGERAIRDTGVAAVIKLGPVASEARVRVEDGRASQADGPGLDGSVVGLLIPIWLGACVAALGLQEQLVDTHVQSVPGEEGTDVVDHIGLRYMDVLQLVPASLGVLDSTSRR